MSARSEADPKYRHYKPKNLAVVRINGKDHYLGAYGSKESYERYYKLLAEWRTTGRIEPAKPPEPEAAPAALTVEELVLAYWEHAKRYYRGTTGEPTQEAANMRDALRPVRRLYGSTPAASFGPLALREVREHMIQTGLSRRVINARVHRIRRAFRWAASHQMIPGSVVVDLETVDALEAGRTEAPELPPVEPVPVDRVEATLPFLPRPVAAMVRIQLLTGMRASEVEVMRGCDLTPGEPLWEYRPASHKGTWRGKSRVIVLGPRAVEIVKEFLKADTTAYLFDPREVANRALVARTNKRYSRRAYDQAIARACDKAFPHPTLVEMRTAIKATPLGGRKKAWKELRRWEKEHAAELAQWRDDHRWSPLQLRHATATTIRAQYGLESAQVVLGHANADVTQIYAERDLSKARAIIAEIG
jgi:integrase